MTALSFTQVEIDGFRGLRSLKLEGLGRVNILVGKNNCGKTSVLEALSVLCQPQNPDEWLFMVRRRDFGGLDETIVHSLRWCFTQLRETDYENLLEANCEFKCDGNFPLRKLNIKYSEFMGEPSSEEMRRSFVHRRSLKGSPIDSALMRGAELVHFPTWSENQLSSSSNGGELRTLKVWENLPFFRRKPPPHSKGLTLDSSTLTPYSYQLNQRQLRSQSKQLFDDDRVTELLKYFDADVEAVRIGSFGGMDAAIYVKHRKLGIAPLSIFGDAMRRTVLLTSTILSLKEGSILLIDEVEVGIHVSALANLFGWLVKVARDLKIQIFVTTHSLEALDAIISDRENQDDIVVFNLEQTEEKTQCKRLSGDLLHRLRFKRGLDVR